MAQSFRQRTGNQGEDTAVAWLRAHHFEILDRNVRTSFGEIDILAKKNEVWHFVEVKTRKGSLYGSGVDAITAKKLLSMSRSATYFMMHIIAKEEPFVLDVLSIDGTSISFLENVSFG